MCKKKKLVDVIAKPIALHLKQPTFNFDQNLRGIATRFLQVVRFERKLHQIYYKEFYN